MGEPKKNLTLVGGTSVYLRHYQKQVYRLGKISVFFSFCTKRFDTNAPVANWVSERSDNLTVAISHLTYSVNHAKNVNNQLYKSLIWYDLRRAEKTLASEHLREHQESMNGIRMPNWLSTIRNEPAESVRWLNEEGDGVPMTAAQSFFGTVNQSLLYEPSDFIHFTLFCLS